MSAPAEASHRALTLADTRIPITTTRVIHTRKPLDLTHALDFWSFAGAAANVIMQLSWPEVGYGVYESKVESGSLMRHPWKRARTTTQYLAVAILGTEEEKRRFREAVDGAHRQVRSDAGSPVKYNAFNRELQLWVAACLYIGFEDTFQLLRGAMTEEQAESFYQSGATLGTTLQVPRDMWPATRKDFDDYWVGACARISLDETIRGYLNDLIELRMINGLIAGRFRGLLRFLTIGFLAPVFREQLGVRWTAADQRRFEHLFVFVSFVNTFIPRFIRQSGSRAVLWDLRRRMRKGKPLV